QAANGVKINALSGTSSFTPIRPPAVPLVTRGPYNNVWSQTPTGHTAGIWPSHWNGNIKAMTGLAMIDGKTYLFLGAPSTQVAGTMTQTSLTTTATQSKFVYQGGGVTLNVDFLSPVEANDLKRLSMPLTDIVTSAQSSDGKSHTVAVYFDISGEWANGLATALINWSPVSINRSADGSATSGTLSAWEVTPTSPQVLKQDNDYADWGTVLFATQTTGTLTVQSGADNSVRNQFAGFGALTGANDPNQPRAINNAYPVFAFSNNFGSVGTAATSPFTLVIGHVRDPAVSFHGTNVSSLWRQYFPSQESMLAFAYNDAGAAVTRADTLDTKLSAAAKSTGNAHYAATTQIALRQAFAATELVGTTANPLLFLEEISSDDNVQTVDVMYPSMPAFLYMNPELVRYLLEPVLEYSESGYWPNTFSPHDLGSTYPNATGHDDGGGENMPVEETANMLIMADAYMQHTTTANAQAYALQHYAQFKQWADYLLAYPAPNRTLFPYPNALDPQFQNQTDDFTGSIAHSVNLALKGIEAVGAMGQIAGYAGKAQQATHYTERAQQLIKTWAKLGENDAGNHLLLQYREAANPQSPDTTGEPDSYWSLKYNSYPDKLLGLNLIPKSVLTQEAAWYKTQENPTGIDLDPRTLNINNTQYHFTKADWETWTAVGIGDTTLAKDIYDEVYNYANTTQAGQPFGDWYDPQSTFVSGFKARPVIGGLFAPLTLTLKAGKGSGL
ncbi:MAG: DUF5127 domain-containing protein, partial [Gluconacetobacter diazotrophicus]|nr:DUF5127 domain-containing protein [Gluconacetobacter diazotrophicus]